MIFKQLKNLLVFTLFFITIKAVSQATEKPFSIDDAINLKNVRSPKISPNGKWVAFTVAESDLEKDKSETRIWMIPAEGGDAIPMTSKGYSAGQPRWSPDNKYLSFIAAKNDGKTQVWTLNLQGGEAQQLTEIKQGVSGHEWSPDGNKIAFLRFDESEVKEFTMTLYNRDLYPEYKTFKYPKVGEKNAIVSVHIFDIRTGKTTEVKTGSDPDMYFPRIKWTLDANKLCIFKCSLT